MAGQGTRALELLRREGITHETHAYEAVAATGRARETRPSHGQDAARALGVDPARLCKTIVAAVDGRLVLAVVPVDGLLDLRALAAACGARSADLAEPAVAERATGYVIGGISPLATRRVLPTVIDDGALEHDRVFVSAGRRGLQVELDPHDLVRVTRATVARLTRTNG